MKKFLCFLMSFVFVFTLTSCGEVVVSQKRYNEISKYVVDNIDTLCSEKEIEFFDYKSTGLSIGGTYYGYYFTANDEIVVPDFYNGNDLDEMNNQKHKQDGGVYLCKPNSGSDWCFVRKITENWYYYELHWT